MVKISLNFLKIQQPIFSKWSLKVGPLMSPPTPPILCPLCKN